MLFLDTMEHKMNSEFRLLHIIQRMMEKEVSNKMLALEIFGVDTPNNNTKIRNSIKVIEAFFGENYVRTGKSTHKLVEMPKVMRNMNVNSSEGMMEVFEFISLFDTHKLKLFELSEPELVRKIKKETKAIYHLFDKPFEEVENEEIWKKLKRVVRDRRYISIAYKKNRLKTYNNIKPIRIVYGHNNWYLAALLTEEIGEYDFTFFRINNIRHVEVNTQSFHQDPQVIKHLENMQSLFEQYNVPSYKVELEVSANIATYFKSKKYLSSQVIIEEKEDGTLLVCYNITNKEEILPLIKKWVPDVRVKSPNKLEEEVKNLYREYVK